MLPSCAPPRAQMYCPKPGEIRLRASLFPKASLPNRKDFIRALLLAFHFKNAIPCFLGIFPRMQYKACFIGTCSLRNISLKPLLSGATSQTQKKPPSGINLDGGFCSCCLITISYHHLGRRAVLAFCHTGLGILGALGALAVGSGVGICPL